MERASIASYKIMDCAGGAQLWRQQHSAVTEPARPVRVLPALAVYMVANLGDPFERVIGSSVAQLPRLHMVGPLSRPILVQATGVTDLAILRLPPWATRVLVGLQPHEIADQVLDLADVVGERRAVRMEAGLTSGAGRWLTERLLAAVPGQAVLAALRQISQASGKISVERIANRAGISRRHLARLFHMSMGQGPKTVSSVIQCQAALYRLRAGNRPTDVAAVAGYSDQAHMTRSFQRLAAISPAQVGRLNETPLHRHFNASFPTSQMCKTAYL